MKIENFAGNYSPYVPQNQTYLNSYGRPLQPSESTSVAAALPEEGFNANEQQVKLVFDLFKDALIEVGENVPYQPVEKAAQYTKLFFRGIKTLETADKLQTAYRQDLVSGHGDYGYTKEALRNEIVQFAGEQVAQHYIRSMFEKNPASAMVAIVLGPKFVESALHDVPTGLSRLKEVTGFTMESGKPHFEWQTYRPEEDPQYSWPTAQREAYQEVRPYLKSFGQWLKGLIRPE